MVIKDDHKRRHFQMFSSTFTSLWLSSAWAQAATDATATAPHPSLMEQLVFPLAISFFIFFFLVLRPQQRKAEAHKGFVGTMKRGDSVLTKGGILGTIEGLTEHFVTLQIADNVKIRILKSHIASGAENELVKK
jgi:preprotein translocase subunit YajC